MRAVPAHVARAARPPERHVDTCGEVRARDEGGELWRERDKDGERAK